MHFLLSLDAFGSCHYYDDCLVDVWILEDFFLVKPYSYAGLS
jgi:hypothetical protein